MGSRRILLVVLASVVLGASGLVLRSLAGSGHERGAGGAVVPAAAPEGAPAAALAPAALAEPALPVPGAARERRSAAGESLHGRAVLVDVRTRAPLPGALFHARFAPRLLTADDEGRVTLGPPGEESLLDGEDLVFEATADGYCVTRGRLPRASFRAVEPPAIPLVEASPLGGHVVDDLGAPVARALVSLVLAPGADSSAEPGPDGYPAGWTLRPPVHEARATAGEDGTFELPGLVPGSTRHDLRVWRPGHVERRVGLVAGAAGVRTYAAVVLARKYQAPPKSPGGAVAGRVLLGGSPIAATVQLVADPYREVEFSDPTNGFTFEDVPTGDYRISAWPQDWEVSSAWADEHAGEVTVAPDETTFHEVALDVRFADFRGRVVRTDGRPVSVPVRADSPRVDVLGQSRADGRFGLRVPDLGEPYLLEAGVGLGAAAWSDEPVPPGASDILIVVPVVVPFHVDARDVSTGQRLPRLRVHVRPSGAVDWGPQQVSFSRTALGHRFAAYPGVVDLWVSWEGYRPELVSAVRVVETEDRPPRFEVELGRE